MRSLHIAVAAREGRARGVGCRLTAPTSPTKREAARCRNRDNPPTRPSGQAHLATGHVGEASAELHGVLLRSLLGARFRGHRPHPLPLGLQRRPQERLHLRPC
uniref:Uncharacterized protein n=1 Tax=Arundo donax TaxID=35708 RepID=A0A0A9F184_ARUDO